MRESRHSSNAAFNYMFGRPAGAALTPPRVNVGVRRFP
jgi:hypothetical protein